MDRKVVTDLRELVEIEPKDNKDVTIQYHALNGKHFEETAITSCSGDLIIICNALLDYSDILDRYRESEKLTGLTEATYDYQAKRCRKIAASLSAKIGYDRDAAIEKCKAKQEKDKNRAASDIGEDGISLAVKRG